MIKYAYIRFVSPAFVSHALSLALLLKNAPDCCNSITHRLAIDDIWLTGFRISQAQSFSFFLVWKLHLFLDYLTEVFLYVHRKGSILGYAMACSNTFGLVTGAFLLGFGLSEIPKTLWKNADWTTRQKVLSHKIAKIAVKLDNAHQELSNAIVVSVIWVKQVFVLIRL